MLFLTVPADEKVFVTVDLGEQVSFSSVILSFRQDNTNERIRATMVSFYGSDDGTTFEIIKENNELDIKKGQVIVDVAATTKCRYLKMTYDAWHELGSTMQFSELALQRK